ncbi:cytochrome c [bacterium]|nr:cytochrome c [bacterium]
MKTLLLIFASVGVISLFGSSGYTQTKDDGKTIFLATKCQLCHSIQSDGIERSGKKEYSDLSKIGAKRTADWIMKYLKKQETIDGVKHMKVLTNNDTEIETLAKWLASHK